MSIMITNEGPLTDDDKATLASFRNSEVFHLARKLMAHEYSMITELLVNTTITTPNELLVVQGQLRGIKQIYALFLHNSEKRVVEIKKGRTLPNGTFIHNIKDS